MAASLSLREALFKFHLIEIISDKPEVGDTADKIYKQMSEDNVLYDDRELRAGEKFSDAELLGMPAQIIVSKKTRPTDSSKLREGEPERSK